MLIYYVIWEGEDVGRYYIDIDASRFIQYYCILYLV